MSSNSREKDLFCQALEISDVDQRRLFVEHACGADKILRAQVEKLLALSENAGHFFSECRSALQAAEGDADKVLSAAESALGTEPETKYIGPYKLLQKLGEGGCGVVYMAEQEQPIRRRVALKIIKLGMDTKSVIARFEAERQALALMDHPNIARVLDAGASETGRPYFVMELVYGVKITDYCDQNRVSMKERLQLFIQVCNAVQHAHQKGIIHRDLKPSNIMVTMHDGVPVPKVIDFGIAKATEQRLTDKTLFTSYAQLMGTPAYMSPEQMELSGLNLDTRSDIYSLGILLYELLTGRTPFDTTDLLKFGVEELRRTICERDPLSPSAKLKTLNNEELTKTARKRQVEASRLVSQLHGDLDWIVLKCLEKDRTRRYATANGLAIDIERYLQEETVLARPPSRLYRLQKLVRRNRMVFLSGAVAIAALFLGTLISTLMFVKERQARAAEARLRRDAELRAAASRVAQLVTQRHFEEADKFVDSLPLSAPSVEVTAELRALGDWHAIHGRWPEAAARFASVVKVNQFDNADLTSQDRLKLAASLLRSGNWQDYEQFRRTEAARLSPTNIFSEYRTFKICLLLPPDAIILPLLSACAQVVEKSFPEDGHMHPGLHRLPEWAEVLSLLEYRRGNFSPAFNWCDRFHDLPDYSSARRGTMSVIKAMSGWRLGWHQSAIVDWAVGVELIQAKSQQGLALGKADGNLFPGAGEDLEGSWEDWIIADILRKECDALFSQTDSSLELRREPQDILPLLYRDLGQWRAMRGEWEQARARFQDLQRLYPAGAGGEAIAYFHTSLALLKLGDEKGFARVRDEALTRFKDTTALDTGRYVIKTALLLPLDAGSASALNGCAEVLRNAVSKASPFKQGEYVSEAWDATLLALLEYRRGNYAKAMEFCLQSLPACKYHALAATANHVVTAMCFSRLNDESAAHSELDKAKSRIQTGLETGFDSWNWREWVFVRLLLQEAEGSSARSARPESAINH
ncbi:MAG: serine/threonine protein kinase [Verrucomicrobia bacterium]|nr:MAG: serine/threonine protein kinase [Verrucomicrobiota bacterium]